MLQSFLEFLFESTLFLLNLINIVAIIQVILIHIWREINESVLYLLDDLVAITMELLVIKVLISVLGDIFVLVIHLLLLDNLLLMPLLLRSLFHIRIAIFSLFFHFDSLLNLVVQLDDL